MLPFRFERVWCDPGKSWIIPLQVVSATLMISCGKWAEERLVAGDAVGITSLFFVLVLLAATQDIAVDGWALTLLSKANVGFAATCQTVGMNIGYFASFTVFLALNDPEFCAHALGTPVGFSVVTLAGYMKFWGWVYLLVTAGLAIFKAEGSKKRKNSDNGEKIAATAVGRTSVGDGDDGWVRRRSSRIAVVQQNLEPLSGEKTNNSGYYDVRVNGHTNSDDDCNRENEGEEEDIREAYAALWRVVQLPSVRLLAVMLVVCRLGMLTAETAAPLKLLEKGASKEALAGLVIVEFPIELVSALVAGRWAASSHPFRPWLVGYRLRLVLAGATTLAVALFPSGAISLLDAPLAFAALAALGVATSFASTLMFTALGDFYNRISDPAMGGAYLTLLNTLANVGVIVPKLGVFAAMDALTVRRCAVPADAGEWVEAVCGPASAGGLADEECTAAGGACIIVRDGFYVLSGATVLFGVWIMFWLNKTLARLEKLSPAAWRAATKKKPPKEHN